MHSLFHVALQNQSHMESSFPAYMPTPSETLWSGTYAGKLSMVSPHPLAGKLLGAPQLPKAASNQIGKYVSHNRH